MIGLASFSRGLFAGFGFIMRLAPLGYSFNLDRTAIYLTLAFLFLAQAMDIHLSAGPVFSAILVMQLTAKGAPGVTGSGFAALPPVRMPV